MSLRASLFLVIGLTVCGCGCGAVQRPAISDIREDVVKVQGAAMVDNVFGLQSVTQNNKEQMALIRTEAERGCQLYERGVSNLLSARCIQAHPGLFTDLCLRSEYLFACTKD